MSNERRFHWPVVVCASVIMLLAVAAVFATRPWQHDRDPADTRQSVTSARPTGVEPTSPSAEELADTAQCGADTSTSMSTLTGITSGRHDAFDRIVLALDGPQPECSAGYVAEIVADGSGNPISLEGKAFLRVTLRGAAAHDDSGQRTYRGPDSLNTPDLENVTAIALAGDFEGSVTIGVGTNAEKHYRVFALSEPTRVVIDVGH